MKNIYRFIAVMVLFMAMIVAGESAFSQDHENYYSICTHWDAYFNAHPDIKLEEDGGYADYNRWKEFWRTRVNNGDSTQKGSFNLYRQALDDYSAHFSAYHRTTTVFSDWHSLGPRSVPTQNIGQVCSIYVDTVSDKTMRTIYIGTNSSGIWRTIDGGKNWNNITDNISSINGIVINGVTDITGDPNNPDILYASASSGFISDYHNTSAGVIKSIDGGRTWNVLFHPAYPNSITTIYGILVDPNHTQRIFALCDTTVFRTVDGGTSWQPILQVPRVSPHLWEAELRKVRNIVMKPGNADIIYVATDCNHWAGHHLSQVWKVYNPWNSPNTIVNTDLTPQLPLPTGQDTIYTDRMNVAVTPANPNMIFVACNAFLSNKWDSTRVCVWKYNSNINSWTLEIDTANMTPVGGSSYGISNGINDSKFEFLVSPEDSNVIYLGGLSFEKFAKNTVDGKWYLLIVTNRDESQYDTTYHFDTRHAKILKGPTAGYNGSSDVLFAGNDGGLSKSINGIHSWTNLNGNGLVITQFYGIGGANSIPNIIVGGSQDNQFWKDSTGVWSHHEYGDWGNIVVDNLSSNYMYGWCFGSASGLDTSKTYGNTWHGVNIDTLGSGGPQLDTLFYREPKLNNPPMVMNPGSKTFYLGSKNLYRTYNRANYFQRINPVGTPDTVGTGISAIGVAPSDTSVIYIAYSDPSYWWAPGAKFFKSIDHGQNWKNLTDSVGFVIGAKFDSLLTAYTITDIAVKSDDPRTLWISFDGFLTSNGDNARVLVSHDAGGHWSNYSNGLPNFPMNCLRYMNGSNDRLFVGTDVGVFYIDNTLTEWQPFNTGMPLCVVTDLEINDNIKEIRAATFGRGIWETTLDCEYYPNNPIEITQNTTWAQDIALNTNVYIDSSYTLTIRSKVSMPPLAKIYVKQGARLVVEGGTITNKCANMWQGIEVWGRKNKPENLHYQGFVGLSDGAVIENARIGITTINKTSPDYQNTTGGIITAMNATFRNNYKAVEFFESDEYQASSFTKVNFETTGPFVDSTSTPSDFVSMSSVRGVCFFGCNFRNTTTTGSIPTDVAGRGIFSINSAYRIDQYDSCPRNNIYPCPNPIHTPSSFKGLYYGIRALNSYPRCFISVNKSNFEGNFRGIYLSNMAQPQITSCKFTIPYQNPKVDTLYGLYLGKSTGYMVQENLFRNPDNRLLHPPGSALMRNIGIVVDSSGTLPNEIYKNTFDTLDIAINAQRRNKSSSVGDSTGLVLKCNKYNNNSFDQMITHQYINNGEGIAAKQGAKTLDKKDPAGNTFSPYHALPSPVGQIAESDIKNQGDYFIYFHHHHQNNIGDPRVKPEYYTASTISLNEVQLTFDSITCCPSKLDTGGGLPDVMKEQLSMEQNKVDSLTTVLNSLVDGGNTEGLNSTVYFSQPPESLLIRQDLLDQSPYLSDTVMKSAIDKESVLPNEMIRDVLVANPQSAKSDNVLNELNNRIVPMPDPLMDEIMNGKDSLSVKEAHEAELFSHKLNRQYYFDELVRYYKNDTINPVASHDSLMALLSHEQNPIAQYMLAFEYYYMGDWQSVTQVLDNVNNLKLTDEEVKQHAEYVQYFNFLKTLSDNARTIYTLSDDDITSLNSLVGKTSEPVKSYCRNILEANNLLKYYEPILLPEELKSTPEKNSIQTKPISKDDCLHVFPNPANQYVIVEYNLANEMTKEKSRIEFSVNSSDGKIIDIKLLLKVQDQFIINTRDYVPGVFLFSLKLAGKILSTKKVTIIN